ncbi:MAG: FHA domain-containing protein [Anaerolineae bacterium]|nr:FHA domain-containing protein [Anaerolineae bacterium]
MTDDTEKTKLQVSEETQAMLAKSKTSVDAPVKTEQATRDAKADAVITDKLANGGPEKTKDDTLVKKAPPPTTRKIPEPLEIERTARYGEAVLGERAKLLIMLRGLEVDPVEIEVEADFIIGRASQETNEMPDLDLIPYGALDKGVSRRHLVIMKREDTLHVMDLESTNGTYLNGVWMYPNQPRVLRDGDELMLGSLVLRIKFIWQDPPLD